MSDSENRAGADRIRRTVFRFHVVLNSWVREDSDSTPFTKPSSPSYSDFQLFDKEENDAATDKDMHDISGRLKKDTTVVADMPRLNTISTPTPSTITTLLDRIARDLSLLALSNHLTDSNMANLDTSDLTPTAEIATINKLKEDLKAEMGALNLRQDILIRCEKQMRELNTTQEAEARALDLRTQAADRRENALDERNECDRESGIPARYWDTIEKHVEAQTDATNRTFGRFQSCDCIPPSCCTFCYHKTAIFERTPSTQATRCGSPAESDSDSDIADAADRARIVVVEYNREMSCTGQGMWYDLDDIPSHTYERVEQRLFGDVTDE